MQGVGLLLPTGTVMGVWLRTDRYADLSVLSKRVASRREISILQEKDSILSGIILLSRESKRYGPLFFCVILLIYKFKMDLGLDARFLSFPSFLFCFPYVRSYDLKWFYVKNFIQSYYAYQLKCSKSFLLLMLRYLFTLMIEPIVKLLVLIWMLNLGF